jgi:cytochrome c556
MRVYRSAVAIAAAGIITGIAVRAAEKPPEAHVKLMKDTNTAAQALRGHAQAKDYDAIAADAASLRKLFADIETFWAARKTEDAIGFAKTGATAADDLETAAKAKNEEGVATASRAVNGTCMGCHTAHRERLPDGTSEIK